MKNLPCIIFLLTVAGVVLLAAASFLGLSFRLLHVASVFVGFAGATGVLALFLCDYRPRPSLDQPVLRVAERRETARPAFNLRRLVRRREPATERAARPALRFGLRNSPATLSLL